MSETLIESDVIYDHEKYGEVLVTGIAKMYNAWDTTGPSDDITSGQVLVFFYDNYDGYGGMNPMPASEPVSEFEKASQKKRDYQSEQSSLIVGSEDWDRDIPSLEEMDIPDNELIQVLKDIHNKRDPDYSKDE